MINLEQASQKLEEKRRLYEQYGKALEEAYAGEYLAINRWC
jgi:hypothetical protein